MECAAGVLTNNGAFVLAINVKIISQRGDCHEPFHEQVGEFHKEPELDQADDEGIKLIAHVLRHEGNFLPFHQLAFGVGGAALGAGGRHSEGLEFLGKQEAAARNQLPGGASTLPGQCRLTAFFRPRPATLTRRLLLCCRMLGFILSIPHHARAAAFLFKRRLENPVHNKIGITPDGGSEMGIGRGRQREMADVLFRVARLLQRPQHQVGENSLLRFAF